MNQFENKDLYINRELSLLAFQHRVLEEAFDKKNPLLERVKFLSIVHSNMDEFYMVRVGGLKMQNEVTATALSADGLTAAEQLALMRKEARLIYARARNHYQKKILPALDEAGIHILDYSILNTRQKESADQYFYESVFPVLTPLAFDPGHPFPHISNLSLNLAVSIEDMDGQRHFARVKVPASLPRLMPLKRSSGSVRKDGTVPRDHYFVWLEQLVAANLNSLFPGMKIIDCHPFRVVRNADIQIQELEADDLLSVMAENVRRRRFGSVVKLAVNEEMPDYIKNILMNNLSVSENEVLKLNGPLGLSSLIELLKIDRYDLKDKPFVASIPKSINSEVTGKSIFQRISEQDIILHHPYNSFAPVIEFLNAAAKDPDVLAIKQTLYRVGKNSPVVTALLRARRDYGKQVAVLVELKARFDEESNIGWAKMLEQEGVHVTYGLVGLKTHSKIAMVIRREGDRIRRYLHLGTGNYNHVTANAYEDIGMFTVDEAIGEDATDVFNYLTGYSAKTDYKKLLVAPINLREKLTGFIEREIQYAKDGHIAHIIFKMNGLVDEDMINLLYIASQAGVKIDLIVRGICCLRPGVEGLSENIQVISVLGRFLEHSRVYYFENGGESEIYMGSADLMPRNIDRRVEILFPVESKSLIHEIRQNILGYFLRDDIRAWQMDSNGKYEFLNGKSRINLQEHFIHAAHVEEKDKVE